MKGYVIVNVEVTDPARYADYIKSVPPTIERFGGRFLVRGGRAERLEGELEPRRIVVLEFPSFERAKAWWSSEEYREPRRLRQSASTADMILAEGVA